MKKHLFAKTFALLGVILSCLYLVLLLVTRTTSLSFGVADNVLFKDWAFIVIPILGLVSSVALQIESVRKD